MFKFWSEDYHLMKKHHQTNALVVRKKSRIFPDSESANPFLPLHRISSILSDFGVLLFCLFEDWECSVLGTMLGAADVTMKKLRMIS